MIDVSTVLDCQRLQLRRDSTVRDDEKEAAHQLQVLTNRLLARVRFGQDTNCLPAMRSPSCCTYVMQLTVRRQMCDAFKSPHFQRDTVRALRQALALQKSDTDSHRRAAKPAFGTIISSITPALMSALASDAALARLFVVKFASSPLAHSTALISAMYGRAKSSKRVVGAAPTANASIAATTTTAAADAASNVLPPLDRVVDDTSWLSDTDVRSLALVALGQMSVSLLSTDASATFSHIFLPLLVALLKNRTPSTLLVDLVDEFIDVKKKKTKKQTYIHHFCGVAKNFIVYILLSISPRPSSTT